MNKLLNNNEGFTLIEAVISLGVLSIGILALFAMQTLSIRGNANASRVTTLAIGGSDEIENKILTGNYAEIITTDPINVPCDSTLDPDCPIYTVRKTVVDDSPVKNVKTIDVIWTRLKDGKQVTLRYLKANESLL